MSPWWNDQITLTLLADGALLRRQARGQRQADLVHVAATPENGEELLLAVQRAVRERPAWQRSARLNVVFGVSQARTALLPWVDDFVRRDDRLAYARLSLRKQFGNAAEDWEIRLADGVYGQPWLVAGVERKLLEGIDGLAAAFGWRVTSAQPALMAVANAFGKRLTHGPLRLMILESSRLLVARIEDGRWLSIRTRRVDDQRSEALPELLAQESLLDPDPVAGTSRLCLWSFTTRAAQLAAWKRAMIEVLEAPAADPLLTQWKE